MSNSDLYPDFEFMIIYGRPTFHLVPKTRLAFLLPGVHSYSPKKKRTRGIDRSLCPHQFRGYRKQSFKGRFYRRRMNGLGPKLFLDPLPRITSKIPTDRDICKTCLMIFDKLGSGEYETIQD